MALKFSSFGSSKLAADVGPGDLTMSIQVADAGKFPTLGAGDWTPVVIVDNTGQREVVRVTARTGAVLTMARAQEGTAAGTFAAGSRVDVRLTAAVLRALQNMSDLPDVTATRTNLGINNLNNTADADKPISTAQANKNTALDNAIAGLGNSLAALLPPGSRIGFYGTAAPAGWVRASGRTIGSASSGATERANADCQPLFLHLWAVDSSLAVSGGRGASAAADWGANKTIALPDYRDRVAAGLATMGNADANLIADGLVDGGKTSSILGATAGVDDVALSVAQMPEHLHANGTLKMPNHGHKYRVSRSDGNTTQFDGQIALRGNTNTLVDAVETDPPTGGALSLIGGSGEKALTGAMEKAGQGQAHTNMQPTIFELVIIKL